MSEIKRKIAEKGIHGDIPDFEKVPYEKTDGTDFSDNPDRAVNCMKARSYVQPYSEINGNKLAVFTKKFIRRMIKFYTEPVISQQNAFNMSAVTALSSVRNSQKQLLKRIERLEKENAELKKQLYGETS